MKITIDLKEFKDKKALLDKFREIFPDMFSANYDALIDVATYYEDNLDITFTNLDSFSDAKNLVEVFEIITAENKKITTDWRIFS